MLAFLALYHRVRIHKDFILDPSIFSALLPADLAPFIEAFLSGAEPALRRMTAGPKSVFSLASRQENLPGSALS